MPTKRGAHCRREAALGGISTICHISPLSPISPITPADPIRLPSILRDLNLCCLAGIFAALGVIFTLGIIIVVTLIYAADAAHQSSGGQNPRIEVPEWMTEMLLPRPAHAATVMESFSAPSRSTFFHRGDEGWYWYHDPLPEIESEPIPVPLPPPQPPEASDPPRPSQEEKQKLARAPEPEPSPAPATKQAPGPAPFTLSWVKEMLPKYMEAAWNNPTKENVEAYFLIQRLALDKANAFADMAQRVVVGNFALDETMRRPVSSPGAAAANLQYAENVRKSMKKIAQHAGIWFFYKSSCRFCEAQAPILGYLESEGMTVLAISMDQDIDGSMSGTNGTKATNAITNGTLRSHQFARTYRDAGHAAKLGVTATPAMYLVSEDGTFDALGMSVLTLDDLRSRILLVGARNGWISEEELKDASPLLNPNLQIDLGKELPALTLMTAQRTKEASEAGTRFESESASASDEKLNPMNRGLRHQIQKTAADSSSSSSSSFSSFIPPEQLIALVNGHRAGKFSKEERKAWDEGVEGVEEDEGKNDQADRPDRPDSHED